MTRRKLAIIIIAVLWTVTAGSLAIAQDAVEAAPNYQISYPTYRYSFRAASIKDVDFKNLTVFWHQSDKHGRSAGLHNGTFQQKYGDGGGEEVIVDLVESLDLPGATKPRAVIDILWNSCGGSCSSHGLVQIFELRSGHPTVVEQIVYDRHAPNTGAKLAMGSKILTVIGRSSEPSANCCPKSLEVATFEWDGEKFIPKNSNKIALVDTP